MKLYYSKGTCSLSPHITLRELGIPFELIKVDTKSGKTESGEDFTKISPNSYVPALELDDGKVLLEGVAIVQYLADQKPEMNLIPQFGTWERYKFLQMMNFITTELHKGFAPLFKEGFSESSRETARKNLHQRFEYVNKNLADKPYLLGENYTLADAYLYVVTNWGQYVDVNISGYENIVALRDRVQSRPAVQEALKAEGIV